MSATPASGVFATWLAGFPSPQCAAQAAFRNVERLATENAQLRAEAAWFSVEAPPDDDCLVLMWMSDGDVYPGFLDGHVWRYADSMPVSVLEVRAWRHLPAGPNPATGDIT